MVQEIISFIQSNPLLAVITLGFLPVSEIRGAAIYAFSVGQHWLILPAMIANILVAPAIMLLWNALNIPWWGKKILGKKLDERMHEIGKRYETRGTIALTIFIGIPLPATGVYTGTLIAELLGIDRKKTLLAAVIGVIISASIMYLALSGIVNGLRFLAS